MTQHNPQVPWTDEQWARARQVIADEASRARVAATFLPLYGPLPADTDYVSKDLLRYYPEGQRERMAIDDRTTHQLATLQVKVFVRGAQMADPELASVLQMFRRAANVLARLEDAIIFRGQPGPNQGPAQDAVGGMPAIWDVLGGQTSEGLFSGAGTNVDVPESSGSDKPGEDLVTAVSASIGVLEGKGHLGPFAVVLGHEYFTDVQTPNGSLVLPQDRILPFLGGGSLLRSSTLPLEGGVVVALGGAPVELVVATDVSLAFLQVTTDPMFVFRVYEKIVLRIKEPEAVVALAPPARKGKGAQK